MSTFLRFALVAALTAAMCLPSLVMRVARLHVRANQLELSLQRLQSSATVAVYTGNGGMGTTQIDQFGIF